MRPKPVETWEVVEAPSSRLVRMPRATGHEATSSVITVNTIHGRPVSVTNGSATLDSTVTLDAVGPVLTSLEVFAGAAFEVVSAAAEAFLSVAKNVALEKQLNSLSVDYYEDHGKPLDQGSMAGLRHFLLVHQDIRPPKAISADSAGRVEATWEAAQGQSASLKFLDDNQFHYALVVEAPSGRKRPWGTAGRFEVFVARPEARAILGASAEAPVPSS